MLIIIRSSDKFYTDFAWAAESEPEGSGTENDPYIITTAQQLHAVRDDLTAYYMLGNDVDLTKFLNAEKLGWQPIGTKRINGSFTGSLDGNGYKITGLWINNRKNDILGLFGYAKGATIKNLGVELAAAGITGRNCMGGLIGEQNGGIIENCYISGSISGNDYIGGLIGKQYGTVVNCYTIGSVKGIYYIGGLVGIGQDIKNCYSKANVSGERATGGLIGDGGSIENCYTTGNISGSEYTGGLIGWQNNNIYQQNSITNCYTAGSVSGGDYTGGLAGWQLRDYKSDNIIKNCYVFGDISGGHNTGAVVGLQQSYDREKLSFGIEITSENKDYGKNIIDGCYCYEAITVNGEIIEARSISRAPGKMKGAIKAAAELTLRSTYEDNGWEFSNSGPWYWDSGLYPKLNLGEESNPFSFCFAINYHTNSGLLPDGAPLNYIQNHKITLPTPIAVRNDQTFVGWYDNSGFSGQAVTAIMEEDAGDKEFWAKWEDLAQKHALTAKPTASTVLINGKSIAFDAYNIAGNNYFKLRDLAYTLSGTKKQFDVGWDAVNNAITLVAYHSYTVFGDEMTDKGFEEKTAAPTSSRIYLDGLEIQFTAYNIDSNNYFKLRDIGKAFDFGVVWDAQSNTIIIDTAQEYQE